MLLKIKVNVQLYFQKIEDKKEDRKVHIFYYVGSNEISEELDKALIGMKKGEKKELTLQVSPHTLSKDIAGKKVQVEVMLLANAKPLNVVKNEAFYQKINPALKSESDLTKFSESSLKAMREKDIEIQEQELLRAQLLNLMDFSVPEESLQNKIAAIEKQKEQDNKNTDSPNDKKEPAKQEPDKQEPAKQEPDKQKPDKQEPAKKELSKKETGQTKQEALDSLRYQFLIAKILEDKKIQVSNEEMDAGINQMARSYGINPVQLMQNEYGKKLSDMLRSQLEENKVLDFIRKEAKRV